MNSIGKLLSQLRKDIKKTGSDYTGIVTRVEGNTAYVQFTGADVADTPVAMTINSEVGDKVRVRVNNGKAWITGNDTSPPTNDTKKIKAVTNENNNLSKRIKSIEDGIELKGIVHFSDLESDEETVINGGDINAVSLAIKESYSMYNGDTAVRVLALDRSEPFPGVESYQIILDPDEEMPQFNIQTGGTNISNSLAVIGSVSNLGVLEDELFYIDMPVYDSSYQQTGGVTRVLSAQPSYTGDPVYLQSQAIYQRTAGGSGNVGINSAGTLYRVSSSRRYKHDIKDLTLEEAQKVLDIHPRTFKYNDDFLAKDDERVGKDVPGFISEEVSEVMPIAVDHDEDGNCEMWNANILLPCLLKLIQNQEDRISKLEAEVKALKENK